MADTTDWDDDILGEDETDDNIIELTDIVNESSDHTIKEDVIELTGIVEADDLMDDQMDDLADDSSVEHDQEMVSPQNLTLSPEQLEAALERVIEKKFADKIETILFEVMEKVIEKEIAKIKESLQKELDR